MVKIRFVWFLVLEENEIDICGFVFSKNKNVVALLVLCHRPMIESGKNPQKYIRFTPEDLERMLNEFFEGKTWSEPKR